MSGTKRVKRRKWEYFLLKSTNETKVEFIYNLDSYGLKDVIESDTYPMAGPDRFRIKLSASKPREFSSYNTSQYGIFLQYVLKKSNITDAKTCSSNSKMVHICVHAMTDNLFCNVGCSAKEMSVETWQSWSVMTSQKFLSTYHYCKVKKIKVTFEFNRPQNIENVDDSKTFFSNTHEDSTLTDFKLTGEDGSSVDVHRVVLAFRSPVMSRMLSGNWKESKENGLKISGSNASMLAQFKRYLYLKKVPEDNLQFHLELACLYEIEDMKAATAEKLCSQLTVERAPQVLALARRLKLDALVESISNYLMDNSHDFAAAVIKDSVVNLKYEEKPLGNDLNLADKMPLDVTAQNLALRKRKKTLKKKQKKHNF